MLIVALLIAAAAVPPAAPVAHSASSPRKADDAVMRRGDAYGWLIQARMALQRGRSLDVVRAVQEATALLPKDADLLAEGAGLLLGAGRREQAEAMAREALAAQPRQKTALRVLADLAANRAIATGDTAARDEAIALYDRLAAEPGVECSSRPTSRGESSSSSDGHSPRRRGRPGRAPGPFPFGAGRSRRPSKIPRRIDGKWECQ